MTVFKNFEPRRIKSTVFVISAQVFRSKPKDTSFPQTLLSLNLCSSPLSFAIITNYRSQATVCLIGPKDPGLMISIVVLAVISELLYGIVYSYLYIASHA